MNCEKSAEPIVVKKFQIKMPEDKRNNVSTAVFRQPVFIMKNIIYASINEGGAVIAMKKGRSVWTWGSNAGGMLGYDKNTDLISCKPKKIFENVKYIVAAVHMGSGEIIVTRMDGSKWATGIGFGNERSESGKKVSTRFVMISK